MTSSRALVSFLDGHKRAPKQPQTHTWFAAGRDHDKIITLHVPVDDVGKLRRLLVADVRARPSGLHSGANSVTEKVVKGGHFNFFADLDFTAEAIKDWAEEHGYEGEELRERLVEELQTIVGLYRAVIGEAIGGDDAPIMIIATRLIYKIHLHFPGVIVDEKGAKALSKAFDARFAREHADLYAPSVVDDSVYATGLRLLYCHKGGMAKKDKKKEELATHAALFGEESHLEVYYVTDVETWQQKREPCVEDLAATSIQLEDPAVELTRLRLGETVAESKGKGKGKGKGKSTALVHGEASDSRSVTGMGLGEQELQLLVTFVAEKLSIDKDKIVAELAPIRRGNTLCIATKIRECPFAQRSHQSNHLYLVVSADFIELRCHDTECTDAKRIDVKDMPIRVRSTLKKLITVGEERNDQIRMEAMERSLTNIKTLHPKLNLTDALSSVEPVRLGEESVYKVNLKNNRWCPICVKEHDAPENCVLISQHLQQILCNRSPWTDMINIPLAGELKNVIFAVNNLNVSVNVGADTNEVKEFGSYDDFPGPYDDAELNRLCYTSLNGRTRDVAKYVSRLMTGEYIYQDKQWFRYTGTFWKLSLGPDDLMTGEMSETYLRLQHYYNSDKQKGWINALLNDLSNVNKRRMFLDDLERLEFEHANEVVFNGNSALLPFRNGVFDSKSCTFRPHQPDDFITTVVPYDLPAQANPEIQQEIMRIIAEILPDEEVRQFLLTVLSLSLEGSNRHNIAMIWTGVGGNGKSFLKNIVRHAFGETYHNEPPATFLTGERPSSDKPNPDLLDVQLARSLITSEPQSGKKINTGFLKFITGQDPVRIRGLHSSVYIQYVPRFIVTLLCNTVPLIEGGEDDIRGIWRRLKIVHFGTVFTDDPNPDRPNERLADSTLMDRSNEWGPDFMLMLIAIYKRHIAEGGRIRVPEAVQRNLEEQKEDNDQTEAWLIANVRKETGKIIHLHRIIKAHDQMLKRTTKRLSPIVAKLEALGFVVSKVKVHTRDPGCCTSLVRFVNDARVIPWEETEDGGYVNESKIEE